MCLLVESIKVYNGEIKNLRYHNERLNRTRRELLGSADLVDLGSIITVPPDKCTGLYKCRVIYSDKIEGIEFHPYEKRIVNSLKIVTDDAIDYSHKYLDRSALNRLFELRSSCDDILIIKNGMVTDTFSGNIVFSIDNDFFTPSSTLLKGTKRAWLLAEGIITEREIGPDDIRNYQKAHVINAMVDIEDYEIDVFKIEF